MFFIIAYAADDALIDTLRIKADQVEHLPNMGPSLSALWILEIQTLT